MTTRKRPRKPPYRPVTADDVTDLALLPKRFDRFAAEVHDEFRLLGDKLLPALERLEHTLTTHSTRLLEIERTQREHHDRLSALEIARKDTP